MSQQVEVMFQTSSVNISPKTHDLASSWHLSYNSQTSLVMSSRLNVGLLSGKSLKVNSSTLTLSLTPGWKTSSMLNPVDGSSLRKSWKTFHQSISYAQLPTTSPTTKCLCMWEMKTRSAKLSMSISVSQWAAWINNASVPCSDKMRLRILIFIVKILTK